MKKSLSKGDRLGRGKNISNVFEHPEYKKGCRGAKLLARQNGTAENRFAVSLVKKYGNAVKRNRSRRILKEIYRIAKQNMAGGYDIVIILYPGKYGYHDRKRQFWSLIRGAGLAKTHS